MLPLPASTLTPARPAGRALSHAGRGRTACDQRGLPLWSPQRPEEQSPEIQRSQSWAPHHYHAKANEVGEAARVVPETRGAAYELMIIPDRAAPQHAEDIAGGLQIFTAVI